MRHAGLVPRLRDLGYEVIDLGNVPTPVAEAVTAGSSVARYAEPVAQVCRIVRQQVAQSLRTGRIPLVLGGDHSLAAGTLAGVLDHSPESRVLWLDAHADANTPTTTPSGNVHGMPLAAALGQAPDLFPGLGWDHRHLTPDQVVLVGLRSIDPGERELIRQLGIEAYTISDVDRHGIYEIMRRALEKLQPAPGHLHLSFDLDVVDPQSAPGVGTPVTGGMTIREAHLAMEMLAQAGILGSLEVVEVNAFRDHENRTGCLATDLILSAFGQIIL